MYKKFSLNYSNIGPEKRIDLYFGQKRGDYLKGSRYIEKKNN
jgi:hypothetical protein